MAFCSRSSGTSSGGYCVSQVWSRSTCVYEGTTQVSGLTCLVFIHSTCSQATEESLLVLQGLGVQTSTSSSFFLLSPTTTFIPTTQIQDIVINEAFKGFEVRFYLAIIVIGAPEVVVVFPVRVFTGDCISLS